MKVSGPSLTRTMFLSGWLKTSARKASQPAERTGFAVCLRHKRKPRAQRPFSLQPHDQVKKFHPPSNGEAIANVTTKHGIHRRWNLQKVGRCKENFDELFPSIP